MTQHQRISLTNQTWTRTPQAGPPLSAYTARPTMAWPRRAASCLALIGVMGLGACSTIKSVPIPFVTKRAPDLAPSRASADNLVRLDAAMRSGCPEVNNIERPPIRHDPRDPAPQRWIARTCNGDIAYDVTTVQGPNGPTVKVTAVPGPIDRPANPNFTPAQPDASSSAPANTAVDGPANPSTAAPTDIPTDTPAGMAPGRSDSPLAK